ncbi:MAG TPA: hypothetical protein VN622_14270, partial [Clostridia bacterium]|nr:hypothetical protein [Clostridia bacterium]
VLDAVQSGAMLASALAVFGMRDALGRLVAQGIIDAVAKAKEERSAGLSATAELQSFDFVAPQVDVEALAKELRRQFASGEYVSAPEKKAE